MALIATALDSMVAVRWYYILQDENILYIYSRIDSMVAQRVIILSLAKCSLKFKFKRTKKKFTS